MASQNLGCPQVGPLVFVFKLYMFKIGTIRTVNYFYGPIFKLNMMSVLYCYRL